MHKRFFIFLALSFLLVQQVLAEIDISCMIHFINSGAIPGAENCFAVYSKPSNWREVGSWDSCAASVGCKEYCDATYLPEIFNKLAFGGVGYTADELALAGKYPQEMKKAFELAKKVNQRTIRVFGFNGRNDESDAFRYFIWSGNLLKELGLEMAKRVLDAHESNPDQPKKEKLMDTKNNLSGIKSAHELIKNKRFTQKRLEREALILLKNRKLNVVSPRNIIPEWRN